MEPLEIVIAVSMLASIFLIAGCCEVFGER